VDDAVTRGVRARRWAPATAAATPSDVRVMSYNLLADSHVWKHRAELYRGTRDDLLAWAPRLRGIAREVKLLRPDVLGVQECEDFDGVSRALASDGYEGLHAPRSGEKLDGSSVFYDSTKFECVGFEAIDFSTSGLMHNAAAIARLRPIRGDGPPIVVGCVHLLFNPQRGDKKLGQLRVFIDRVEANRAAMAETSDRTPRAMLLGDFNAEPGSDLYRFVSRGVLNVTRVNRREMSGVLDAGARAYDDVGMDVDDDEADDDETRAWARWEEEEEAGVRGGGGGASENAAVRMSDNYWDMEGLRLALGDAAGAARGADASTTALSSTTAKRHDARQVRDMMTALEGNRGRVAHSMRGKLVSAYASVNGGTEPRATSCHGKFTGTVDYVFLGDGVHARRVLMPPSAPTRGIPNEEYPSDHFSVVADVFFDE
jgi:mRNA deadenylase 3'-5' endonuclease subunit Ccr4